jgi:Histidine kinase
MRSQLNPHFILNTFHALVGLVRRDPAVAEAALEQLGDLLRYSLRIQRESLDEVTLRDEWAFVQSYGYQGARPWPPWPGHRGPAPTIKREQSIEFAAPPKGVDRIICDFPRRMASFMPD